jgi:hypothetical protein
VIWSRNRACRPKWCPCPKGGYRGAEHLGMQQVFDDVDHRINIFACCSVPSVCGGVPHLKSGLKHSFFGCAHKPAAHQSFQPISERTSVSGVAIQYDVYDGPCTHHCQAATIGVQRDVGLLQELLTLFSKLLKPAWRTTSCRWWKKLYEFVSALVAVIPLRKPIRLTQTDTLTAPALEHGPPGSPRNFDSIVFIEGLRAMLDAFGDYVVPRFNTAFVAMDLLDPR